MFKRYDHSSSYFIVIPVAQSTELQGLKDRIENLLSEHSSERQMQEASKALALRLAESTSNEIKSALETQILALTNRINVLESDNLKTRHALEESNDRNRDLLEEGEVVYKQLVQSEEKLLVTKGYLSQSQEECKRGFEKVSRYSQS